MAKTASEIVKKSNDKRETTQVNFRATPEEMELLDQMSKRLGGRKSAIMAGLVKLKGGNAAESAAVAEALRKLADDIDPK